MVQLDILSGRKAGTSIVARRFPFHIGRASDSSLSLDDGGVWDPIGLSESAGAILFYGIPVEAGETSFTLIDDDAGVTRVVQDVPVVANTTTFLRVDL